MEPREPSFSDKRRAMFLDTNMGSMQALRAADAATGRFSQGGQYFYNVDGKLQEVNKEAYRKGQHVRLSPEELKAAYLTPIEATMVPVDPIFDDSGILQQNRMTSENISTSSSVLDDLEHRIYAEVSKIKLSTIDRGLYSAVFGLERVQGVHNGHISNAGNVSASNDPVQQPNDGNEQIIEGPPLPLLVERLD